MFNWCSSINSAKALADLDQACSNSSNFWCRCSVWEEFSASAICTSSLSLRRCHFWLRRFRSGQKVSAPNCSSAIVISDQNCASSGGVCSLVSSTAIVLQRC
jgi:hypothetical protein